MIYVRVLSHCPPYHHAGLWQDAAFLESGIAVMAAEVDIQLAPAVCDANTAIIALRERPKKTPFDLLTNGGCALGEWNLWLPVLAGHFGLQRSTSKSTR